MSVIDTPPFAVACPSCRATVGVDRSLVNEPARCPLCGGTFRVPDPGPIRPTRSTAPRPKDPTPAPATDAPQPAPREVAPQRQQSTVRPTPARDDAGERARQAAQERARRRSRRTIIVLLMGIAILVVLAMSLARGGRR